MSMMFRDVLILFRCTLTMLRSYNEVLCMNDCNIRLVALLERSDGNHCLIFFFQTSSVVDPSYVFMSQRDEVV